jgi:hypothetical protein
MTTSLDPLERFEFLERLSTIAAQPAVTAADEVPKFALLGAGHFFVSRFVVIAGHRGPPPYAAATEESNSGAANMNEHAVSKKRQVATKRDK